MMHLMMPSKQFIVKELKDILLRITYCIVFITLLTNLFLT